MDNKGTPKHDEVVRRPLYLYDLPPEVLVTLQLKADAEGQENLAAAESVERPLTPSSEASFGSQGCSLCSLSFATFQDQRGHIRSDLHAYNLKQKLRGATPVTEAEFEKLVGTLDESLSGSDDGESDSDDEAARKDSTLAALLRRQATLTGKAQSADGDEADKKTRGAGNAPLMWFSSSALPENSYFGIYRAVFAPEELSTESAILEGVRARQLEPIAMPKPAKDGAAPAAYAGRHVFLCMIGGGHFAAMVVSLAPRKSKHGAASGPLNREATVLAHKTFHRYTTRRKQGGAQSTSDNAKGAAHSAGAALRRYNEQALTDDVRALLREWKGLLDSADLLFVRATGATNRRTLFGPYDGQVLRAADPRIRGFPFSTRRATQNELMRAFIELTRLKVREITPQAAPAAGPDGEATKATGPAKPKPSTPRLTEEEETALLHTTQLQALIRRSKLPALLAYLKNNNLPADFRFQPADANHHAPTPLHLAAAQNAAALIAGLVARAGADPTAGNGAGRTPFELAGDRATRDAFRVARAEAGEAAWDWEAARVPPAMGRDEAERREERDRAEGRKKEAERRRDEEARLRAAEAPAPATGATRKLGALPRKTAQEVREDEARGLAPEVRLRLERERRARAAEERMRRMQAGG